MNTSAKFERYKIRRKTTWAYLRFRGHHSEMNSLYWSYVPVIEFAKYKTKNAKPDDLTKDVLKFTGTDDRRPPRTIKEWRKSRNDFSNWVRLGLIMSSAAYLETYMRDSISLALMSDPLSKSGISKKVDGILFLKMNKELDTSDDVKSCLVGSWQKRLGNYRRLFGSTPSSLEALVPELEKIRHFRNRVGHAFGRNLPSTPDLLAEGDGTTATVGKKQVLKWLGVIEDAAKAIDAHLRADHIGEFESLLFYHKWQMKDKRTRCKGLTEPRALSKAFGERYSDPPGVPFCEQLITYYQSYN
jgi:hypothetical protein